MKTRPEYQHVHVGAGAIGLGLIAWLTSKIGLSVIVTNREANSASIQRNQALHDNLHYEVTYADGQTEVIRFSEFIFHDSDPARFIEVVSDPNTLILTTALKDGLSDPSMQELIAEALVARARSSTSPLYLIACENEYDSEWLYDRVLEHLPHHIRAESLARKIIVTKCMIDRLCTNVHLSRSGTVAVSVERFAQWIIQRPIADNRQLEEALSIPPGEEFIQFVTDLEPHSLRKRWLVNGPHLLIALHAYARHFQMLHTYLNEDDSAQRILDEILNEALQQFLALDETSEVFSRRVLRDFNSHTASRFTNEPDFVFRILSRFNGPDNLHSFLTNFHFKVGDLAVRCIDLGLPAPQMTAKTLFLMTKLVYDGDYYTTIRRPQLDLPL